MVTWISPEDNFYPGGQLCPRNIGPIFSVVRGVSVWMNVLDPVDIVFLPLGHTNSDLHQSSSPTSNRLRYNDAVTLRDLQNELQQCYNDQAFTAHIDQVGNWSGLCMNSKCCNSVDQIMQFRYFRFSRQGETKENGSKLICRVRRTVDKTWIALPMKGNSQDSRMIRFVPDFKLALSEVLTAPPDFDCITARIISEETTCRLLINWSLFTN